MSLLKNKLAGQIPGLREEIKSLVKGNANVLISDVSVAQAYGGMRGVKGMICDTSVVEPDKGLIIRGIPILEIKEKLPEEIFWLLLTGELPSAEELKDLQAEFSANYAVPDYVWKVLEAMPKESHPMCMLDTAILVMEHDSEFRRRYPTMAKTDYWDAAYDDAMKILGTIPNIAAGIYRMRYDKGARIEPDMNLDWAANYVHMLGLEETPDCYDMMRLYLTLHTDHEGGNVSANTCHTVGSALSDPFYAVSAGLNGLAGPLHGLANQECLGFVIKIHEQFGGVPTEEELTKACWDLLNAGQVVPGYGHAVLRVPDPRFVAFHGFGKEHCAADEIYQVVDLLYQVAPKVLKEHGKAKNPWPNVDAGSGALLYHYGLKEFPYYTVLFSVSRAMGMLSQLIINRAIGTSITRPKSVSTEWIKDFVAKAQASA